MNSRNSCIIMYKQRVQVQHGTPHTLAEAGEADEQPVPAPYDRQEWKRRIQDVDFQPFAGTLSKMENNLAASCLCSLVDEVSSQCVPVATSGHGSPAVAEAAAGSSQGQALSPHLALWLYGLMVRLEQPVTAQVAAALRRIVRIAEAGLERCRDGAASNSQDSSRSGTDCAGDSGDIEMSPPNAATAAAEAPPQPQQACDLASSVDCAESIHVAVRSGGAACQVEGGDGGGEAGDKGECVGDPVPDTLQEKNADACLDSSCRVDGEPVTLDSQGTAEEIARCDTLRILAGGFFGQDRTLAPLVHSYLFRETAQSC